MYLFGVVELCKDIYEDKRKVYDYIIKGNIVVVIIDGIVVLGLGNIGFEVSIFVMEGKVVLFKSFVGINGVFIVLNIIDIEEIIKIVKLLEFNYGGINLEDILVLCCFEIEEWLKKEINILVFYDDQYGIVIVIMVGLVNVLRVVNKDIVKIKVVLNGVGVVGIVIVKLLYVYGVRNMVMCDLRGVIFEGCLYGMNFMKDVVVKWINKDKIEGFLEEVVKDVDVFIGVFVVNVLL